MHKKIFIILATILSLALIIRLTIRDSFHFLATFYYATPYVLIALIAIIPALIAIYLKDKILIYIFCAIFSLSLILFYNTQFIANYAESVNNQEQLMHTMFLNLDRMGVEKIDDITNLIKNENLDIAGFVETTNVLYEFPNRKKLNIENWKKRLPNYDIKLLENQMLVITKGEILKVENIKTRGAKFNKIKIEIYNEIINVVIVDIASHPFKPRKPSFDLLYETIANDNNLIFMGDFNTPLSSVHFDKMKKIYQNAFLTKGSGNIATFPTVFPILAIDNIWFDKNWNIKQTTLSNTGITDHYAVISSFTNKKN